MLELFCIIISAGAKGGFLVASYDLDRGNSGIIKDYDSNICVSQELKVGEKVRVKHFNISEYAITEIVEISGNTTFKIRISPKIIRSNVFEGDSITIVYINNENEESLADCVVEKAQAEYPSYFVVRCIRIRHFKDCRKNRRYEIDACCNIIDENNSWFGNIKNISFNGCRIMTKASIDDRKNFKLEVFLGENKKSVIDVGVVRVKKHMNCNEYGLIILNMDDESRKVLTDKINSVIESEKEYI